MKNLKLNRIQQLMFLFLILSIPSAYAVNPALTYHGRLMTPDGVPVASSVQFKIQIRSPGAENCLLWEETQTQDLSTTAGNFSVGINDGTGSRTDGGTNTFVQIFANTKPITVAAGKCASGTTYTPSLNDARKMVVSFNDGSGWEDASAQAINYVPKAIDALQVAGFPASSLLRFAESDGTLVGTTPLNNAQYTALTSLIAGTSNLYLKNSSTAGTAIPQVSGTPATLTAGSMWFDTSSGALKFYDGSSAQTVGASSGTVSSIATGTALTGGPITTTGTIDMATLGTGGTGTKISYDKYGRVTGTTTLAEADIPTLSTAGKVSGSAINSGTISGTAGVYTSGDVTATNVSSTHAKTRDAQFFDSATNAVTLKSPSILTSSYTLTLPTNVGSNGNILATDASGNLSWIAPTTGSVVSVSGTPPIISSGGATPTISITKSDATHDGYLSSSDWSTFSSKLGSTLSSAQIWVGSATNTPVAINISGDASLNNTGNLTVTGLRGKIVSATAPTTAGQVLRYDGTNTYAPAYLSLADIRSSVTPANTAFPATSCTSSETLTWSSLTDSLTCTAIAVSDSSIAYTAQSANKILASPSATTGTPAFRTLVESDLPSISTAGKVSGNAITSGTLSGTTAINTSGDVTAVNVSSTHAKTRDAQYFDSTTNTVTVKAPNTVTSYTLTLPPAVGADGNVLATDSSGNLSWIAPTTGSVVSVSGTPPIVSSGGATPTISIAKSDASHDGYLSSGDWSTFNSKLGSTLNSAQIWVGSVSNVPAAVTVSGDLTLSNAGTASVIGLRGKMIGTTTPTTAGQVLRYDGTNTYVPTFLSLADVRSAVIPGNTMFPATPCTAAQTLTWSSLTDTMSCTTIAIADSAVTFASQTANKVLASPSAGSGTPAFRTLVTSDLPTVDVPHGGTGTTTLAANKVVVANGTGTALTNFSCTSSQIFGFDASGYPTCTDFSSSGGFINGGNAFGANANLGTKDNYDLNFMTGTTTRMTVTSSGKVGIGTTTPTSAVDIAGGLGLGAGLGSTLTTLNGAITATSTVITVASTANYPSSGVIVIGGESIAYTGTTATTFTGLTHGVYGSTPASHPNASTVYGLLLEIQALSATQYQSGFSVFNNGSVVMGAPQFMSMGANSLSIGTNATATGSYALAVGGTALASGRYGFAHGSSVTASGQGSTAMGATATSAGVNSMAVGDNVSSPAFDETVLGAYNVTGGETAGTWVTTDPLFVIGNGVSGTPANALTVLKNGNMGIGTSSPTYKLSVAGDVNVTGNFRVNGTILSSSGGSTLSGITNISNASGDITLAPATGTGAVQINSGTASTSSTTGALVVAGGMGVSGGINSGGTITSASDITSGGNLYTTGSVYGSQLYGTSTASGSIKIDGTSGSPKGAILLNSAGGNVGIGTTTPSTLLDVVGTTTLGVVGARSTMNSWYSNTAFWIDMPTTGPSGIGSGGAGVNPWIAYVKNAGNWFADATSGDIAYRNTSGKLLFGSSSSAATMSVSSGNVGIGTSTPVATLSVAGPSGTSGATGTSPAAALTITGGAGGNSTGASTVGAVGAAITLTSGAGGNSTGTVGAAGGTITLQGGAGGTGTQTGGYGPLQLNPNGGVVYVGGTSYGGGKLMIQNGAASGYAASSGSAQTPAVAMSITNGFYANTNSTLIGFVTRNANVQGASYMGALAGTVDYQPALVFGQSTASNAFQENMRILGSGNVGIGTTTPAAKLTVAGPIVSLPTAVASGASADLSTSNTFTLASVGGTSGSAVTIALSNLTNGGVYTIVVTDTVQHTYDFSGCTNKYWKPGTALTTTGTRTLFNLTTINTGGSNYDCYISWATGYQ